MNGVAATGARHGPPLFIRIDFAFSFLCGVYEVGIGHGELPLLINATQTTEREINTGDKRDY